MKLRTCGPPGSALAIAGLPDGDGIANNSALDKHDANAGAIETNAKKAANLLHKKL